MNRLDFTHLGGMPLTQNRLSFMQNDYQSALSAVAKLCGDKSILDGVVSDGVNVTSGWISYNGELIKFVGGSYADYVTIAETSTAYTFADNTSHNLEFTKTATCSAISGDFLFSDLVPLLSLQNMWLPGDVKEKYVDNTYIAANFDSDGYGINKEKGWRIFSKAVPAAAGKIFINRDASDGTLDTVGNTGGAKTFTIAQNNLPASMTLKVPLAQHTASGSTIGVTDGPAGGAPNPRDVVFTNTGGGQSINKMPPYFVILKLVKL